MKSAGEIALRLLLLCVGLAVLYALVLYTINVFSIDQTAVGLIHVYSWVPYLLAASILACLIIAIMKGAYQRLALAIGAFCLSFFLLSLRITSFNASDGEILDEWPFYAASHVLAGLNDQEFCYKLSLFSLQIVPSKFGQTISIFRGVWPSYFGEDNVRAGLLVIRKCSP